MFSEDTPHSHIFCIASINTSSVSSVLDVKSIECPTKFIRPFICLGVNSFSTALVPDIKKYSISLFNSNNLSAISEANSFPIPCGFKAFNVPDTEVAFDIIWHMLDNIFLVECTESGASAPSNIKLDNTFSGLCNSFSLQDTVISVHPTVLPIEYNKVVKGVSVGDINAISLVKSSTSPCNKFADFFIFSAIYKSLPFLFISY